MRDGFERVFLSAADACATVGATPFREQRRNTTALARPLERAAARRRKKTRPLSARFNEPT